LQLIVKLLFVYPPFCTPTVMPYSISGLKGYLEANLDKADIRIKCLDLNAKFHRLRFPEIYTQLSRLKPKKGSSTSYLELLSQFDKLSRPVYSENNKKVLAGKKPDCFEPLLDLILQEKPDLVAFSLVYNSQCFYAKSLMEELTRQNIDVIIGGPADASKLSLEYNYLNSGPELLEHLDKTFNLGPASPASSAQITPTAAIPDFSDYEPGDYLSRETILPIKSSSGCCYRLCAFCTHHKSQDYSEISLETLRKTIEKSPAKNFFFIDDFIPTKRLLEIAKLAKSLGIAWSSCGPPKTCSANSPSSRTQGSKPSPGGWNQPVQQYSKP
jgi:hypothetical protein